MDVIYKQPATYKGSKKFCQLNGVNVQPWFAKRSVIIQPLDRNGVMGHGMMEIPYDEISSVIKALEEMKNDVDNVMGKRTI